MDKFFQSGISHEQQQPAQLVGEWPMLLKNECFRNEMIVGAFENAVALCLGSVGFLKVIGSYTDVSAFVSVVRDWLVPVFVDVPDHVLSAAVSCLEFRQLQRSEDNEIVTVVYVTVNSRNGVGLLLDPYYRELDETMLPVLPKPKEVVHQLKSDNDYVKFTDMVDALNLAISSLNVPMASLLNSLILSSDLMEAIQIGFMKEEKTDGI